MKRVKIMLTSVAVLAVVGGALAFKANKFIAANVYCSTFQQGCLKQTPSYQTTQNGSAIAFEPCGANSFYTEAGCVTAHSTTDLSVYQTIDQ